MAERYSTEDMLRHLRELSTPIEESDERLVSPASKIKISHKEGKGPSIGTYIARFGSLNEAARAEGLKTREQPQWLHDRRIHSNDELLGFVRKYHKGNGYLPTFYKLGKFSGISIMIFIQRFRSPKNMAKSIDVNYREELLKSIQEKAADKKVDTSKLPYPSKWYDDEFGGVQKALQELNLYEYEPEIYHPLLEELRKCAELGRALWRMYYEELKMERSPRPFDFHGAEGYPSYRTFYRHFIGLPGVENWDGMLRMVGIDSGKHRHVYCKTHHRDAA